MQPADTPAQPAASDDSAAQVGDLSALAWVHDELRRTLEAAQKSLRRALRERAARPADAAEAEAMPPSLSQARSHLHQAQGVLVMVGLPAAARCLQAAEQAVAALGQTPDRFDADALALLERASFAVMDYLRRQLAGQPVSPLALFPSYRDALGLARDPRVHPADLCPMPEAPDTAAHWAASAAPRQPGPDVRGAMERALLALMRHPEDARPLARLSEVCAGLAAGASGRQALLWHLASAFFEAQASGALAADDYTRRMPSRLLAQVRASERGGADSPERLIQDLRFFCARAAAGVASPTPRLDQARQQLHLPSLAGLDYQHSPLGRIDPALLPLARRRTAAFRETWSGVSSGDPLLQPLVAEQSDLVAESVRQLYPDGERLAQALRDAARAPGSANGLPTPAQAMEVATALLCIDASLDEMDLDQPELAGRVNRLAQRLETVAAGAPPQAIEPWMEALYRQVSDRQTMGSVVQELRASLADIEQQLDRYHRHPAEHELLIPVPGQLAAMRGVLSVLGLDQASQAVLRMREDVDSLMVAGSLAEGKAEDAARRLADNLGGLSFLIDMLGAQPELAKALFRFDPATGRFSALMGRAPLVTPREAVDPALQARLADVAEAMRDDGAPQAELAQSLDQLAQQAAAADAPALAQAAARAHSSLAQAVDADATDRQAARDDLARAMEEAAGLTRPATLADTPPPAPPPAPGADDDMREVFLEEAREVLAQAQDALALLQSQPRDLGAMTSLRRAFHTLKGSARMVGLTSVGDAGWACEQLFNARLAEAMVSADAPLRQFTGRALAAIAEGVEALARDPAADWPTEDLIRDAQALRDAHSPDPTASIAGSPQPPLLTRELTPGAPGDEIDTVSPGLPEPAAAAPVAAAPVAAAPLAAAEPAADADLQAFDLDLDLPLDPGTPAEHGDLLDILTDPDASPHAWDATELAGLDAGPAPHPVVAVDFELDLGGDDPPAAHLPTQPAELLDLSDLDGLADATAPAALALPEPEPSPALAVAAPEPEPEPESEPEDFALAAPAPEPEPEPGPQALALEEPEPEPAPEPEPEAVLALAEPAPEPEPALPLADEAERYKVVGPLRIPIGLFNVYLNEADEQSRRLAVALAEWQMERDRPVADAAVALAHSLAGNSATVGYESLSALARRLEHALERAQARGRGSEDEARLYADVAEEMRRLLHQFAAGFLRPVPAELLARLEAHEATEASLVWPEPELADEAPLPAPPAAPLPPVPVLGSVGFAPLADRAAAAEPTLATEPTLPAGQQAAAAGLGELSDALEAQDQPDAGLWPIFAEEADELLPALAQHLRQWEQAPAERDAAVAAMRCLHTFKGGARLAGAMGLGELAHRLESAVEQLSARGPAPADALAHLHGGIDRLSEAFQALAERQLRAAEAAAALPAAPAEGQADEPADERTDPLRHPLADGSAGPPARSEPATAAAPETADPAVAAEATAPPPAPASLRPLAPADWGAFLQAQAQLLPGLDTARADAAVVTGSVRVRVPLLDRMVSHAGEVGAARARIDRELGQMRGAMKELTDNLDRLRRQLRDLEIQAETQMSTRLEAARAAQQVFDPLEMDRFTRVQELTRMLAESVNDVGTVQRTLQQSIQTTEDQLAWQTRLTRDLQDDLLRARMVEFDTLSERLYRVVRQAAKETGKQVRLNLDGGATEIDRGVLDRMAPAFEHLLRNAVVHGIEPPRLRESTGKDAVGSIDLRLKQSGNEVQIEVRDDGAGLDLARIAERARLQGLLADDARPTEAELAGMIFQPGFSTVDEVTELAGRGIGMDIVRAEVTSLGGRIDTASATGRGTAFRLVLPLTTAVTQVVVVKVGERTFALPATLVERVQRTPVDEVAQAHASGGLTVAGEVLPFFWLGGLLAQGGQAELTGRTATVVLARSASQRVALHVDQVLGNQDVVVKNLGPQLARLPGLSGLSMLPDGSTVLIYNPVALAAIYGEQARALADTGRAAAGVQPLPQAAAAPVATLAPLVLVVDDSLTVRRVTQRLLLREGYRVQLAKDGLEALERLAEEAPAVVLCDIEMPRMDGFDLLRNLRADTRWHDLPVIMITSRIAQKHRDHALELGANHYLGKPFDEQRLLALLRQSLPSPATAAG